VFHAGRRHLPGRPAESRTEPGPGRAWSRTHARLIGQAVDQEPGLEKSRPATAAKAALRWSHQTAGGINVKRIASTALAKSCVRVRGQRGSAREATDFQFLVPITRKGARRASKTSFKAFPGGQIDGAVGVKKIWIRPDAASGEARTRWQWAPTMLPGLVTDHAKPPQCEIRFHVGVGSVASFSFADLCRLGATDGRHGRFIARPRGSALLSR